MVDAKAAQEPLALGNETASGEARRKLLFLAQLPPPLHGASGMSKRIYDIMAARGDLSLTHLWLGGAASNADVGKRSPTKMLAFIRFVGLLVWQLLAGKRYAIGYLTLAPFAHAALRDGVLIALSKLLAGRTIVHLHALGIGSVMAGRTASKRLLRRLIRDVELITLTAKDATTIGATGHFKSVHHLPNGIEDPGVPLFGTSPTLRCGFLANLDPRKGVLRFLDGIEALRQAGVPATGRIAGDSTGHLTRQQLEVEVARRGLADVVAVVGPLYGEAKTQFFATTDVLLYLSAHDYFPLVVIEALAGGAVPVVFDIEGQRELVGPTFAGNVVAPDLPQEALLATVVKIVRRYHEDRTALAADRRLARARFEACFTIDRLRQGFNAILAG